MAYVLASASPRRRELLPLLGIRDFTVCPARGPEPDVSGLSPAQAVILTARTKLEEVLPRCASEDTCIAADTLVFLDDVPLGKPADAADAARMLRSLSGREHKVLTGLAVARNGRVVSAAEETAVIFRPLREEEILRYVESGEPLDKAGAYGIQGCAAPMISGIRGDYYNVMGLPLCRLGLLLEELDGLPREETK